MSKNYIIFLNSINVNEIPENYVELEPVVPDAHIPTFDDLKKAAEDLTGNEAKVTSLSK